jgi:hypothetical protein
MNVSIFAKGDYCLSLDLWLANILPLMLDIKQHIAIKVQQYYPRKDIEKMGEGELKMNK